MASTGPSSASPKSQVHQRTSSTQSAGKASAGQRPKTTKSHAVGKNNRNTSFGRNLNKLGLVGAEKPARPQRSKSHNTPSTSPSSATVRRNKSEVALPRTGSKVQIKKNQSAVALRRNESAGRLKRLSRPPTPRKEDAEAQLKGHAQPAFGFGSDEEEEDEDEWTEESASQSPIVTRNGSPKVLRPALLADRRKSSTDAPTVRGESPKTPVAEIPERVVLTHPTNSLDPTDITKRLLTRTSTSQLAPKLSTISAGGSSGAQSPARPEADRNAVRQPTEQISVPPPQRRANEQAPAISVAGTPLDTSLGRDGVSRFLDPQAAASSSGRNALQLHDAMGMLQAQRERSPSPNPATASAPAGEGVRRAKSAVQLSRTDSGTGSVRARSQQRNRDGRRDAPGGHSRQGSLDDREWTVTIDPAATRRSGGNVQARMELWRSQAENELNFLRMFRNPAVESAERVRRERKKRERERARGANGLDRRNSRGKDSLSSRQTQSSNQSSARSAAQSMVRGRPGTMNGHAAANGMPNGTKTNSLESDGSTVNGDFEPHTPSRRSVRFDVGGDGNAQDDASENGYGESRLATLLRSLWEGVETEIVE